MVDSKSEMKNAQKPHAAEIGYIIILNTCFNFLILTFGF